jgi:eukaryotic-like serine/threonine-protein kinase
MSTPCPEETDLAEFARGGLSRDSREEIEQHIDACETCGRLVGELLRVFGSLDARHEVPSGEPTLAEGNTLPPGRGFPLSLREGAKLGRYVVLRKVGAGGMGVVYAAYDPELDRKVALKLLRPDDAMGCSEDTLSQRNRRLLREAQAMARLHHRNVVTVHDVGTFEDRVFIAMEFVDGGTLREWLVAGRRSWRETLAVFRRAGAGLVAAHEADLVHRDFKPDNVLLGQDGRVVVTDLGLARPLGEAPAALAEDERTATHEISGLDGTLTRTGALVGTPAYMSPEQLQGKRADASSDQFSFCVALYEAVYGERPFSGDGLAALVASVLDGRVRSPPADVRVPRWLRRVLLRGLTLEPSRRYADMTELLAALRPPSAPLQLGTAAVVLGILGVATSIGYSSRTAADYCEQAEDHLRGVWDPDIAAKVEEAFAATALPFATQTGVTSVQRVDAYANRWAALQVETCQREKAGREATGLTALRMACLATRRDALETLAVVFQEADTTTVVRAPDMIDDLAPLSSCEDTGALASGPPPPPSAISHEVEAIRGLLARATVLGSAGKRDAAAEHDEEALRWAEVVDYEPVRGEALLRTAQGHEEAGSLDASEASAHEALTVALATGHMLLAADASHQLAHLALIRDATGPQVERWVAIGRATLEQISGGAPLVDAKLRSVLGSAQRRLGQVEASVSTLQDVLAIFVKHFGEDDFRLAAPMATLGLSLARLGRYDEAGRHLERARDLFARKYGRDHLGYAASLQNLGASYFMQGAYEYALELYQESLERLEAVLGPEHANVGVLAYSVSTALLMLGRHDEALRMAHRANAIGTKAHGDGSVSTANDWSLIGEIHARAGDLLAAENALRRALAELEAADPDDRRRHAFYRSQLGATLAKAGELEEAERLLTGALDEHEALRGPEDEHVAETLGWLADLHLDGHRDPQRAQPLAERSLAIYDSAPTSPQVRAEARFRLARVLAALEPASVPQHARELAQQAVDILRTVDGDPSQLAVVQTWLRTHGAPPSSSSL